MPRFQHPYSETGEPRFPIGSDIETRARIEHRRRQIAAVQTIERVGIARARAVLASAAVLMPGVFTAAGARADIERADRKMRAAVHRSALIRQVEADTWALGAAAGMCWGWS